MRLAIITSHPIQYNAPFFAALAKELDVHVFYTWGKAWLKDKYDPDFGTSVQWDIPLLEGYTYSWVVNQAKNTSSATFKGIDTPGLPQQVLDFKPTAVLVYGWAFKGHYNAIKKLSAKVPVWFRGDSTLLDTIRSGLKEWIKKAVLAHLYKHVSKAFYVGEANKAYFKYYGIKEENLVYAPHAIDNQRFMDKDAFYKQEAADLRASLKINVTSKVILFVGKFSDKKAPLTLLNAFKQAKVKHSHLVFVGNGQLEEALKELATNLMNVHFLPFQNQKAMPSIYRLGNVLCLPSKGPGETWGLAVNEAMACGIPAIVSTKVGCAADMIKDGRTGWVFNSETQLSKLIYEVDSGLLDSIDATYVQAFVQNNFSYQHFVDAILKQMS